MKHARVEYALNTVVERAGWPLIAAFAAFVALAGVWTLPPLDRDEARFAQASAQMLESGDFIVVRFQDEERNKKPAGIHWLQAASVTAFSDPSAREIWAYRLPSVIGASLAAVFTYFAAATLYDRRTAAFAGLLLAAAPLVAAESTIAKTDAVLLALVCLAQLALIRVLARAETRAPPGWGWPAVFWAAQGAAVLIKGPIGPVICLLTGLGFAAQRRRFDWLPALRPVSGLAATALIAGPWAVAIGLATEGRFFSEAIGGDMFGKIGAAQEQHGAPPGYHAGLTLALFWPAAALIAPGLFEIWRERGRWGTQLVAAWLIPAWAAFELAATKLPHYVLPLYPALAIIAARAITAPAEGRTVLLQKAGAVAYCLIGLGAAALLVAMPLLYGSGVASLFDWAGALSWAGAGALVFAAPVVARLFWRGDRARAAIAAALLAALYAWLMMGAVMPGLTKLSISPRLAQALEDAGVYNDPAGGAGGAQAPAVLSGYNEPSAIFLLGARTRHVPAQEAARRLLSGEASAAVIEARRADAFLKHLGDDREAVRAIGAPVAGINYSKGRNVSLTIYVVDKARHKREIP